ncbi:MAG: bifunctional hydroxymethylpyrimidine kinase/phosphomethylpyrimidine kinase [Hyphomicrobium sp.]
MYAGEDTRVRVALTIAGSDPSGGAGIQADLKTFTVLGVYGASVITALTAQNTMGVTGVLPVPPAFTDQQIDAVAADLNIAAIKTGMLGDTATVIAVAEGIKRHGYTTVVADPVMVATSGDLLLAPDAIDAVRAMLIPLALLITPNLHEAAQLLGTQTAANVAEMEVQGRRLLELGARAVLIKGGHMTGASAIDVLVTRDRVTHVAAQRVDTRNTHGTGCTLSAAIAAHLALGCDLEQAVHRAKLFLTAALLAAASQKIGHGAGPVDHLHALRAAN